MLIRQATKSDIADVARVHVAAWDAAKDGLDLPSRRTAGERSQHWTAFLGDGVGELWVAEEAPGLLGFLSFGPSRDEDRPGETELYTLYVDPEAWGRGVGSALMEVLPAADPVSLWVAERNIRARDFYARHGFTPDGAREAGHHVPVIRVARAPRGELPAAGGPVVE